MDVYQRLLENPDRPIVSIHLSSGMSGTYQSAMLGKSLLERDADLTVIDSKSASYGYGLMVVQAAELAEQGKSVAEIVAAVQAMQQSRKLFPGRYTGVSAERRTDWQGLSDLGNAAKHQTDPIYR